MPAVRRKGRATIKARLRPGFAIVDLGPKAPHSIRPRRYIMRQWLMRRFAEKELEALLRDYRALNPDMYKEWRARLCIAFFDGRDLEGDGWKTKRRIRYKEPPAAAA